MLISPSGRAHSGEKGFGNVLLSLLLAEISGPQLLTREQEKINALFQKVAIRNSVDREATYLKSVGPFDFLTLYVY